MSKQTIRSIRKRISSVKVRHDGILQIDIDAGEEFGFMDMQDLIDAAQQLGDGKKFLNLIKLGEYTLLDYEARTFSASRIGSEFKIADAFVINSLSQKIVTNFYLKFHKPVVPTKIFTDTPKALEWLREIGKKDKKDGSHRVA